MHPCTDPVSVQEKLGLKQNSNEDEIKAMCEEVIDSNPQSIISSTSLLLFKIVKEAFPPGINK